MLVLILCIIYTGSNMYLLYQTGSVDTQVAAFNNGKSINYQLAEILIGLGEWQRKPDQEKLTQCSVLVSDVRNVATKYI